MPDTVIFALRHSSTNLSKTKCSVQAFRILSVLRSLTRIIKDLSAAWGTDWPVNDTVKYAKETVGLGTCIPQRYVKSEEKDKDNYLYTITSPGNKYLQYHTTFTSMKETFGYKTPEAWFAYLREWKEELAHPVTVKIKDIH